MKTADIIFEEKTKVGNHNHVTVTIENNFWGSFSIVVFDEIYDIWKEAEENDEENARSTAEKMKNRVINYLNKN